MACNQGRCALPDLVVDEESLRQSIRFDEANFGEDDCTLVEGCAGGSGLRRLLRFTLAVNNIGGADLVVGDPATSPQRYWSMCHQHFHMAEFTTYRLINEAGDIVADGHKQAFCLRDTQRIGEAGPEEPVYDCENQGISVDWSDSYGSDLDCQWVDITGVPPGAYQLEVIVNEDGSYPDLDRTNNRVRVPVEVPADPSQCIPQEEICHDGLDQSCAGEADSGCPPLTGNASCADAWHIGGSGVWSAAIGDPSADPAASCGGSEASVFFRMEILRDEIVFLSTHGSTVDTVLSIIEESCGGQEIACTAGSCGKGQSQFVGLLSYGMHFIQVSAAEAGTSGVVRLRVERSRYQEAKHIASTGAYFGDTSQQGANTMTSCGLGHGPEEFWYFTTCPGETTFSADTCGDTHFNTVLELREGSCRGPAVACNDDLENGCATPRASAIHEQLQGEGLWFLLVDGYAGDSQGEYQLNVDL